ncbi:transposase [Streptomyces noursei]|uniref:transposase n=1 Tax=Streptomyces noursei TaxID=1971 RepID=UPI00069FD131
MRVEARPSTGSQPPALDPDAYIQRYTVERSINRIKQWRGLATRTDKPADAELNIPTATPLHCTSDAALRPNAPGGRHRMPRANAAAKADATEGHH